MDGASLVLLGIAVLGVVGKNQSVAIAVLALLLLRLTQQEKSIGLLDKYGVTLGIILLTAGVMAPIAGGRAGLRDMAAVFGDWRSLAALGVGALVAYLGGRGVRLMADDPLAVNGLLLGTILGVAFFRGVPVGPLIAAGILAVLTGRG
ncbi:DUF441 domain-containing protein [Gorillibacterium sp. sgz5001074]|uniref:DUF441 domain-containing protein n=1 Tax=Gorillibacterium sp. sgz5001074 TaxID=3446695 RepID=UPI003F67001B